MVQTEASKEINSIFPESLRARVLEFVQFRNTARMDDLGEFAVYFYSSGPSLTCNS